MSRTPAAYLAFQRVLRDDPADLHPSATSCHTSPLLPQPCSANWSRPFAWGTRHPRNRLIDARASPGLALITSATGPAGGFTAATGTQFRAGER